MSAKTKRALKKKRYLDNKDASQLYMKEYRKSNRNTIRESQKQYYEQNKDAKKLSVQQHYEQNKDAKILCVLQRYEENKDAIKLSVRQQYQHNKQAKQLSVRQHYQHNKQAKQLSVRQHYQHNKQAKQLTVRQHYEQNKQAKQLSVKQYYERNKDAKLVMRKLHYQQNKECTKIYCKNYYTHNRDKLACKAKFLYSSNREFAKVALKRARKYYARNRTSICASKRRRYNMAEPKPCVQQQYVLTAKKALLHNKKVMKEVINYFMSQQEDAFEKMNKRSCTAAIAQVAAHRLIAKALQIRKQYVGLLLKTAKHVCGLHIKGQCDFGEGLHSVRSEPYYYESIYYFEHKPSVFVIDSCGRCCQDIEVHNDSTDKVWKCSSKCKPLTECELNTVLDFKSDFDRPMCELLPILLACDDGCPNTHYSKVVHETDDCGETDVPRKGHSLLGFLDSNCKSKLRILRSASAHYPTLRSFLHAVCCS